MAQYQGREAGGGGGAAGGEKWGVHWGRCYFFPLSGTEGIMLAIMALPAG